MNKSGLAFSLLIGMLPTSGMSAVIGFWDFDNGFDVADETVQIVHNASIGSGVLYQQRADTDGNGKGGVAYTNAGEGIDVVADRAMAWDDVGRGGENDAEFFVVFSTTGFQGITVSFDLKGNGDVDDEIVSYDLKFALVDLEDVSDAPDVAGTIKDFQGEFSTEISNNQSVAANGDTFTRINVNLTSLTDINNQSVVALRFDDWKENDQMSIDNLLITGTAIPEPSSALLLGLGGLLAFRRRR